MHGRTGVDYRMYSTALFLAFDILSVQLDRWSKAFPPRVLGDSLGQSMEEIASSEGPWGQLTSR